MSTKSFHPSHVIKNIAKGLLIGIRRICSRKFDYLEHGRGVGYLIKRGYNEKWLTRTLYQVSEISRDDLLIEKNTLKERFSGDFCYRLASRLKQASYPFEKTFPCFTKWHEA